MLYRITNKTHDGLNVELAGLPSYIGPGEQLDVELGRLEADALPESVFDVVGLADAEPAQSPAGAPEAPAAPITPGAAPAAPEAPTAPPAEQFSNIGA